jgi:hypothetical protein
VKSNKKAKKPIINPNSCWQSVEWNKGRGIEVGGRRGTKDRDKKGERGKL